MNISPMVIAFGVSVGGALLMVLWACWKHTYGKK